MPAVNSVCTRLVPMKPVAPATRADCMVNSKSETLFVACDLADRRFERARTIVVESAVPACRPADRFREAEARPPTEPLLRLRRIEADLAGLPGALRRNQPHHRAGRVRP